MTDHCRSCGAAIIWAYTRTGKPMPVEAAITTWPDTGNITLHRPGGPGTKLEAKVMATPAPGLRRSHFVTCPQHREWRRGR